MLSAFALGKNMNPTIVSPAMEGKPVSLSLVKEKGKSEFKPVKFHLKIDLVSHPARA